MLRRQNAWGCLLVGDESLRPCQPTFAGNVCQRSCDKSYEEAGHGAVLMGVLGLHVLSSSALVQNGSCDHGCCLNQGLRIRAIGKLGPVVVDSQDMRRFSRRGGAHLEVGVMVRSNTEIGYSC